jgi:chemotaxis protein MotB
MNVGFPFAISVLAVLALAPWATGCVTTARHDRVVADLERQLELERQSAMAERERLYAESDTRTSELEEARRQLAVLEQELAPKARKYDEIHPTYEGLVRDLEADLAAARIQMDRLREGFRTSLPAEALFPSGSADLTADGERVLAKLAAELRAAPYQILVQGHTDGVAIRGALAQRFPTNWELAAARATNVVRFLQETGKVAGRQLLAAAFSQYRPASTNKTEQGRQQNRRIEIVLLRKNP